MTKNGPGNSIVRNVCLKDELGGLLYVTPFGRVILVCLQCRAKIPVQDAERKTRSMGFYGG